MLRTLFRAFSSQSNQTAVPAAHAAQRIDPSLLKLVAGGDGGSAPKGGWLSAESQLASEAPKGGW